MPASVFATGADDEHAPKIEVKQASFEAPPQMEVEEPKEPQEEPQVLSEAMPHLAIAKQTAAEHDAVAPSVPSHQPLTARGGPQGDARFGMARPNAGGSGSKMHLSRSKSSLDRGSDTTATPSDCSRWSSPRYAVGDHVHNRLAAMESRYSLGTQTRKAQP